MKTLRMVIEVIIEFGKGVQEGIGEWQTLTKLPRWVCWIIGLLVMPFNLVAIVTILILGGFNKLNEILELGRDFINKNRA